MSFSLVKKILLVHTSGLQANPIASHDHIIQ
jgi:hypothetical protein